MIIFGDSETRDAYDRRCDETRRAMTVQYAVAPLQRVATTKREFLEGEEITLGDLDVVTGGASADQVMRSLVRQGLVLEAERVPRKCSRPVGTIAAAYKGGLAGATHGVLVAGDQVAADDFPQETLERLVANGVIALAKGRKNGEEIR